MFLIQNGYPEKMVYRILYKEKNGDGITQKKHQNKKIEVANTFYVPFHSRAKKLYNILQKKFGITTVFKKTMTLGNLIKRKGKQIEKRYTKNAVYKVPCGECEKAYLGQTKNTLDTRNGQHRAMCRRKLKLSKLKSSKKDNGLAFHHIQSGHEFDFANTQVIKTDTDYYRRLIHLVNLQIRIGNDYMHGSTFANPVTVEHMSSGTRMTFEYFVRNLVEQL